MLGPWSVRRSESLACALASAALLRCGGTTAPRVLGGDSSGMLDAGDPPADATPDTASDAYDAGPDVAPDGELPVSICAGGGYTCALGNRGRVWCWGSNAHGQLATPSTSAQLSASPVVIAGLPGGVADIACGYGTVCARTQTGRVVCWGDNAEAECGVQGATTRPAEVNMPSQIDGLLSTSMVGMKGFFGCALTASALQCWGDNNYGECGTGPPWLPDKSSPQSLDLGAVATVAAGTYTSCAHLQDGTVKCWGMDWDGVFGDDGLLEAGGLPLTPTTIPALAGLSRISMGGTFGCGLDPSQAVVCWGSNRNGELGRGSVGGSPFPPGAVVGLPGPIASVAAGNTSFACALTSQGSVWCWGTLFVDEAQAAIGSPQPTPAEVPVPRAVAQVAVGDGHVCALASDHSVWCWGANQMGQLGLGTTSPSVPTPSRVTIP